MKFKVISDYKEDGEMVEFEVLKDWVCGDGCCFDTVHDTRSVFVGDIIEVDDDNFDDQTYEFGSEYNNDLEIRTYRPLSDWMGVYFDGHNHLELAE